MVDPTDDEDEENPRRKKKDEGEGDADSWGRGKAGAGAMAGRVTRHLPPPKLKEVMADWRHLDMGALVEAVAEFFSELPMRASANLSVAWKQTKSNAKSFALVNWVIAFGDKAAKDMKMSRERVKGAGRDTRGLQNRRENKIRTPGIKMEPNGPTGQ
jgi:hypothetical protein